MPVSLDGQPCLEPRTLYLSCRDTNLSTEWVDKPNAFTCPLGCEPGEGWLLLAKSALDAISPDGTFSGLYDLTFGDDVGSITLKSLVVVSGECLTPGVRGGDSAYLVRVADRRWFLKSIIVDVAYNMRSAADATYLTPTLDGSKTPPAPWTWTQLVEDLWGKASMLGVYPGLPFSPDGTPGDVELYQRPFSEALEGVLDRLGCALQLDPTLDTFDIVQVGAEDTTEAAATQTLESAGLRIWDGYTTYNVRAEIPEKVRVLFRKIPHTRDGTSPYHALDVADTSPASGTQTGTIFAVEDELEAQYAVATLTNAAALTSRANERATDTFRRLKAAAAGLRAVYAGVQSDPGILPGSLVDSTRWSELASGIAPSAGLITEVVRAALPTRGDYSSVTQLAVADADAIPIGTIAAYGGGTIPAGWMLCNGSLVSRTTFSDLFKAIGETWGAGDGATTFGTPDLQGRTIIGTGSGASLTPRGLTDSFGEETHTLIYEEMPSHVHTFAMYSEVPGGYSPSGPALSTTDGGSVLSNTNSTGNGQSHNNMQPSVAVNYMIKFGFVAGYVNPFNGSGVVGLTGTYP